MPGNPPPPSCVRRIARDVADIMKTPMSGDGVYYAHNQDNVLSGTAMVIGADGGPYAHGCYFFAVEFPNSYPQQPPTLKALTQDRTGRTRFHPNLYRNGKVCRAGLNTWRGQGWTSCMSLRSALLDIAQAMNQEFPIVEEPDFTPSHVDAKPYTRALTYKNYEVAVLGTLAGTNPSVSEFWPVYAEYYGRHREEILAALDSMIADNPIVDCYVSVYEMVTRGDYRSLRPQLEAVLPRPAGEIQNEKLNV
jgi:ubiquitin-conjugating enzyme E2 Z